MNVAEKYGLTFVDMGNGIKTISDTSSNYIASYISEYNDTGIIQEYLDDINLLLNDNYDLIEDTTKSTEFIYAKLYTDGLYFDEIKVLPILDLKALLLSWKEFLEKS
jgi:hypothetical protein